MEPICISVLADIRREQMKPCLTHTQALYSSDCADKENRVFLGGGGSEAQGTS